MANAFNKNAAGGPSRTYTDLASQEFHKFKDNGYEIKQVRCEETQQVFVGLHRTWYKDGPQQPPLHTRYNFYMAPLVWVALVKCVDLVNMWIEQVARSQTGASSSGAHLLIF